MNLQARASYMWEHVEKHPGVMVAWYLMTSYLYYKHDISLLPDDDYDRLCKRLLDGWSSIKHPHKKRLDLDSLKAGTGYALKRYPRITMGAAHQLAVEDGHLVKDHQRHCLVKPD